MLEGSGIDSLDIVAPFLGKIVDGCCRSSITAPVIEVTSSYSDFANHSYRRRLIPGWTDDKLSLFKEKVEHFKNIARKPFEQYQCSRMQTKKWHTADHTVKPLWDVDGLEYLHAGQFESSHKQFKRSYCLASKRKLAFMNETVAQQAHAYLDRTFSPGTSKEADRNRTRCRAMKDDGSYLVPVGLRLTFESLISCNFTCLK